MKKSISKRVKITGGGKFLRRKMGQGHFRSKKSGGFVRLKRKNSIVAKSDIKTIQKYAAR